MNNPYRTLVLVLCMAGAIFSPISYFIVGSVPLTALGVSAIMIGFTCIMLASTRPDISPGACQLMLKIGMENTAAMIEELWLKNKAIYLLSSMRSGHPQALLEVFRKVDKQSNIVIISQCNHEAEALSFNAFQLVQKENTIIYV
ncbi:hypothetical protein ACFLVO_03110 [Chloroflexota bacterium]